MAIARHRSPNPQENAMPGALQKVLGMAAQAPADIAILSVNMPIKKLFFAMQSQCTFVSDMAGVFAMGFNYAVLPFVMRMQGIKRSLWPEHFEGLQIMELAYFNELAIIRRGP